jgi:hypothetical protein
MLRLALGTWWDVSEPGPSGEEKDDAISDIIVNRDRGFRGVYLTGMRSVHHGEFWRERR